MYYDQSEIIHIVSWPEKLCTIDIRLFAKWHKLKPFNNVVTVGVMVRVYCLGAHDIHIQAWLREATLYCVLYSLRQLGHLSCPKPVKTHCLYYFIFILHQHTKLNISKFSFLRLSSNAITLKEDWGGVYVVWYVGAQIFIRCLKTRISLIRDCFNYTIHSFKCNAIFYFFIQVAPGETALAFYTAKNPTEKPIIGISTYNVVPFEAGQYFNKIQVTMKETAQLCFWKNINK